MQSRFTEAKTTRCSHLEALPRLHSQHSLCTILPSDVCLHHSFKGQSLELSPPTPREGAEEESFFPSFIRLRTRGWGCGQWERTRNWTGAGDARWPRGPQRLQEATGSQEAVWGHSHRWHPSQICAAAGRAPAWSCAPGRAPPSGPAPRPAAVAPSRCGWWSCCGGSCYWRWRSPYERAEEGNRDFNKTNRNWMGKPHIVRYQIRPLRTSGGRKLAGSGTACLRKWNKLPLPQNNTGLPPLSKAPDLRTHWRISAFSHSCFYTKSNNDIKSF